MFEKQLIKTYLYLNDRQSTGKKEGFLGTIKDTIKQILEYQLHDNIGPLDILTGPAEIQLENTLINIKGTSTIDFFQLRQKEKINFIKRIINNFENINNPRSAEAIQKGKEIVENLQENITNESIIINFIQQSKELCKYYLDQNSVIREKLQLIVAKKELAKELSQGDENTEVSMEQLKQPYFEEIKKESFEIIKNNFSFLSILDQKFTKSYHMFVSAIESENFHHAKRILKTRDETIKISGLYRFYDLTMNYLDYLEDNQTISDKGRIKKTIQEMATKTYNEKDHYLSEKKGKIANRNIHRSQQGSFYDICTLIETIVTCGKIHKVPLSNQDILGYLLKSKTITKEMCRTIIDHKYSFTEEETQKIAKELFQRLEQNSQLALQKDEEEKLKEEKRLLALERKKGPNKMEKVLIKAENALRYIYNRFVQFIQTLKGVPKALLMGIAITLLTIFKIIKGIAQGIMYIISLFKKKDTEDGYNKEEEGENNSGNGGSGLEDNKTFAKLLDSMKSQGIKDLLNNMFNGSLLAMSDKKNNLRHERNLLDRGKDTLEQQNKLQHVDIINYENLDSKLLVGEVFFRLEGTRWEKELIDHKNRHVLEKNDNGEITQDYSFFLDQNNWKLQLLEDVSEYPTLTLGKGSLTRGINSIVCPRGYVPVLSENAKKIFNSQSIGFKLYCIKNLGYYYLALDKVPTESINLYYVRYGDTKYNGIFFNTLENQGVSGYKDIENMLTANIINMEELPEKIKTIVNEQSKMEGKEDIAKLSTEFLSSNFLYSQYRYNTTDLYKQHSSYMAGIAHTGVGDCKNINTLNIGLLREQDIQTQECAGYVKGNKKYEGHGVTEANIDNKCLLLDATPHTQAPDEKKQEKLEQERKAEERRKKIIDQLSLVKSFLGDIMGSARDRYQKRRKTGEKIEKVEKRDMNLVIEKNITRIGDDLVDALESHEDNDGYINKEFEQLLRSHIENLINKQAFKQMPKEAYTLYLSEYYKNIKNLGLLTKYFNDHKDDDSISAPMNTVVSDLSKSYEYLQQMSNRLNYINKKLGTNINIQYINEQIIRHKLTKDYAISNDEVANLIINNIPRLKESEDGECQSILMQAIIGWIDTGFTSQTLPYDMNKIVDADDIIPSSYITTFDETEKSYNVSHKADLLPNKVKKIMMGELESIRGSLEKEIYKNYNNQVRTALLSRLNEIFLEFHNLDDSQWVGRSKKNIERMHECLNTREDIENRQWVKERPIAPSYKLDLIISVVRSKSIDRNLTERKIKNDDPCKIKYEILSDLAGRSSKIEKKEFLQLLEQFGSMGDYKLVNLLLYSIKKDPPYSILIGDLRIEREQIQKELIPSLEKKLLTKYSENPIAILDLISSKDKLDIHDYDIIESNLREICGFPNNSTEEKIMIEKAIFSVIETILKKEETTVGKAYGGLKSRWLEDHYIGRHHLEDVLELMTSEQLTDLCQKAYRLFHQEEKEYRKSKDTSYKLEFKQKLRNISEILGALLNSLGNYKLEHKNAFGTKLLRFRIDQLNNRIRKHLYGPTNLF